MKTKPLHPSARKFLNSLLFKNLTCFKELEKRIENLHTEQERGAAFEVFAEAYFATQVIHQAKLVWPDRSAPRALTKKAGLTSNDQGSDGIIETKQGTIVSYQVKFRTGRPNLTWREISTFIGQTDQVDHRILFTNSCSIAEVANKRINFSKVGGDVLDLLQSDDFNLIENWLSGLALPKRVLYDPKPHQIEAIKKITTELVSSSRTTATMACGTGKTLTALWVAEELDKKNILILVPSLSLLRQILRDWLEQSKWKNLSYLCICSDDSVDSGTDEIILKKSDLEFDVTTDIYEIQRFMDLKFEGVKLIFSTYQSAEILGKAAKRSKFQVDLAIFDEAHKTAGKDGRAFSFALHDKNILIKKRLFLTATPRHFDVLKKNKDGDASIVYSMDDQKVYGKTSYALPFSEAANRKIICPFKVIISVITSDQINKDSLQRSTTKVKNTLVQSQQVANQISLTLAVKKYGIKKIFSFHRTVASAKEFTSENAEGVVTHLPGFKTDYVSGAMSTGERNATIVDFKQADKAIIANARCLTEGVDVPSVDMVAFLSPRKSMVDIVQAAGRAMRRNDKAGKKYGFILIPIYVEQAKNEGIESALKRTNFDHVWTILEALQEQDEVLAEVIRQIRITKGEGGKFDDGGLIDKVEIIGPSLNLSTLRKSFTLACVDALSSTWEERFGELKAFKAENGNCNVPSIYDKNQTLANWVIAQRSKKKLLTPQKINNLVEIGFDWDPLTSEWEKMFFYLEQFRNEEGHCNVPKDYPKNKELPKWVHIQLKRKLTLSDDRKIRLGTLGFDFNPYDTKWAEMYSELLEFKKKEGHANVPSSYPDNQKLATWTVQQRIKKAQNKILKDRIKRMDDLGFDWDPFSSKWEKMFSVLKEYKKKEGNCNVPQGYTKDKKLATWVSTQRADEKKLPPERKGRLIELGFEFKPNVSTWDNMFSKLMEFKKKEGHCNVPNDYIDFPKLGNWVGTQRSTKNKLPADKIKKLNAIDFDWNPLKSFWEDMFSELIKYKKEMGDCNVSKNDPNHLQLATWVQTQRTRKKKNRLSADEVSKLEALDFDWDLRNNNWDRMFIELQKFKLKQGHCNVPLKYKKNPSLGSWVSKQRFRKTKFSSDRLKKLKAIGFKIDE